MGMIFCRGCGHQIHESAVACPQCGAPNDTTGSGNPAPGIKTADIPDGVKGWSWGAFLLNWIWAIGNRTWIGLLAIIPYVGVIMAIILGIKGREWAWKNKQWESVEHFNAVQRKWSIWGGIITGGVIVIGIVAAIAIPAYQDYAVRSQEMDGEPEASSSAPASQMAVSVEPSPYPLPQLSFDQADFIGGMKRAQMEPHWVAHFTAYLIRPDEFWTSCVSSEASVAQEHGGMNVAAARQHGEQACQSITSQFHQCLNRTPLGNAILCLQEHINNVEMNGE